jgi:hypothetical protein
LESHPTEATALAPIQNACPYGPSFVVAKTDCLDSFLYIDCLLHIQIVWIIRLGNGRLRRPHAAAVTVRQIAHFILDIPNKPEAAPRRRKDHRQTRTGQQTKATAPIGFARRSWPQPKGRTRHRRDNGHPVGRIAQKAAIGLGHDKDTTRHARGDASDAHDLVKGHVDFNVANPKAQRALRRDFDVADVIVPKPGQEDEIRDTDRHDGAVRVNRYGGNHQDGKDDFEEKELNLDACRIKNRNFA